jgi:hypothetical protein
LIKISATPSGETRGADVVGEDSEIPKRRVLRHGFPLTAGANLESTSRVRSIWLEVPSF